MVRRTDLKVLGFRTFSPEAYRVITERAESLDMAVSDYLRRLVKVDVAYHVLETFRGSGEALEGLKV